MPTVKTNNAFTVTANLSKPLSSLDTEIPLARLQLSKAKSTPVRGGQGRRAVLAQRLRDLEGQGPGPSIDIKRISIEELEDLRQTLSEEGIRFRFDWNAESSTAILRMTSILHSAPLASWLTDIHPSLQQALEGVAPCGQKKLLSCTDASVELSNGSKLMPDASMYVYDPAEDGVNPVTPPRVVFECAASQSLASVLKKARKYLFHSKVEYGVHAVAIVNMENPPSKVATPPCLVTLDIWVREPTGNPDAEFPLDDCGPSLEASVEQDTGSESSSSDSDEDSPESSSSSSSSSDEDASYDASSRLWPTSGHSGQRMWKRNDQTIVVYDESLGDAQGPLPPLVVDAYDFLRICSRAPDVFIPRESRDISIELTRLREVVKMVVQGKRQSLRDAAAQKSTQRAKSSGSRVKRPRHGPEPYEANKRPNIDKSSA